MQFRGDERGQAIQIGAVLLLGALVISFSLYQALVVPDQNRGIEFNHNQRVQGQLQELRNGIVSTASGGGGRSVSVQLGTRYPSRVIALNPGPPSGTLTTVGTTDASVNATVANAAAAGEVGDYWTGANRTFNTGSLRYRPGYNEYANAPVTWYEHSVLFNRFRDSNLTLTGQRLIDGTDITLVTLNGSYYADRSGSVSVDVRAVSAGATTVSVTNATPTSNVTITLPTHLSERDWEELLRGERQSGYVAEVSTRPVANASYQLLRVELERGPTYDLQLARAGVGTNVAETGAAYLTDVAGNGSSVPEGGTTQLTVEVRDRLDNPVDRVGVTAGTRRGDSSVSPTGADSDGDGEVTLTYQAPADISGVSQRTDLVNASIDVPASAVNDPAFDPETPLNVTMVVRIDNSDGSGLGGGGGGDSAYSIDWQDPTQTGVTCDPAGDPDGVCTVNASRAGDVDLTALTDPTAQGATVDFSLNDSSIGSISPTETTTGSAGAATTTFTPEANGSVAAFVASGGSGDRLDLVVENVAPAGGGFRTLRATSMPPYSPSQRQNITLVPSSDVPAGETITVELSDPQQSSPLQVAYNGPNAAIVRGGSSVSVSDTTTVGGDRAFVNLSVDSTLPAGTPVELRLKRIRVGAPATQTDPYDVIFDRSDTADTGTATFDIAYADGRSALSTTSASDLQSGQSGQLQTVSFTLDSALSANDQVLIELSDPQSAVDYSNVNSVGFATGSDGTGGTLSLNTSNDNATLVYTGPGSELAAGSTVEIEIDGVDTAPESTSEGTYTVGFSREDADVAGANYTVGAAPSSLTLDAPTSEQVRQSSDTLDVTYSYSEENPDTTTITFDDNSGNTATYTIDDSAYAGDNSEKTVTLDLSSPDSTTGSGFVDGNTYDITVTATDGVGRSSSTTGTDLLTVDDSPPADLTLDSPSSEQVRRSNGSLDVTYSYTEANPSTARITFNDNNGNTATYTVSDGSYAGDNSGKTVSLDLSNPDSTSGNGFVDGNTYDITVRATDTLGQSSSTTGADLLTIDDSAPSSVTLEAPASEQLRQSTGALDVTYSYVEDNPNTARITFNDNSGNTATYTIDDSSYAGDGSNKTVTLDLGNPDSTTGSGFVDGNTYDITVEAVDQVGQSNSDTGTDLLTIDDSPPSSLTLDSPTSEQVKQSSETLDVSYSYSEANPDTTTITLDDNNGNTATYTIDDSAYVGDNSEKLVTLDLSNPDTTGGNGLVDGNTYDIEVEATDALGQSSTVTGADLLTIDNAGPTDVSIDSPTSEQVRGTSETLDVTYSYTEANPSTATITFQDGNGNTASYTVDDSAYAGDNTGKTVTLDLSNPDNTGGNGFVDGNTYDITVTATDQVRQSGSATGTDLLTIDSADRNAIQYNSDGAADGPSGSQTGVSFSVTNTGSTDVRITQISIDSSGSAGELLEKNGGSGQWNREVYVDASTPGYLETGDGGNDEYNLGSGSTGFTSDPTLGGGTTATFSLYQFTEPGPGGSGGPVNMNGEPVSVTLTFGDGTTKTISFTG